MAVDPALESTVRRLQLGTRLTRLEVLALMAHHADRIAARADDMQEVRCVAEAQRRITAAIDRELLRGLKGG